MSDASTVSPNDKGLPPPVLPDLELVRPIGRGAFGEVWLAANRSTGLLQAVKTIRLHCSDEADRAGRELMAIIRYQAGVRSQHPNLLTIHHVGETAEYLFYTMDPADDLSGKPASAGPTYRPATLASVLHSGALSPEDCLRYARELLTGVARLHEAGMIHRDVKPSNCVLVGEVLRVADFGLLTEADRTISRLGTPRYMRPDGRMDPSADTYAAGLIIYEMITGSAPDSFPSLGPRGHEIGESFGLRVLNRVALDACDLKSQQGFDNAQQMLARLDLLLSQEHRTVPRILRNFPVLAASCLVMVFLAALGWRSWLVPPSRTHVNFITEPYEATICLDGTMLGKPEGTLYTTPCTVPDLPARVHHVVFRHEGLPDLDMGPVDFGKTPEIVARWKLKR